ncbi:hypothetical protein EBZ39_14820 [bacterium]|nr:hypothetical protein [bacterium]
MDLHQWASTFGLPAAALIAIGLGVWRITEWSASNLIIPLRDKHFEFLESLQATLKTIADTQEAMASEINAITRATLPKIPKDQDHG